MGAAVQARTAGLDDPGARSGGCGVKGRIAQLLMMAAFGHNLDAALQLTARLFQSLPVRGGVNEAGPFLVYLLATQEREVIKTFGEVLRRHGFALRRRHHDVRGRTSG